MSNSEKNRQALDFAVLGGAVGIISMLTVAFLPEKFNVSPLVIFGIIFLSNITTIFVPEDVPRRGTGVFSRFFFARLALSVFFAVLLIFISDVAQRF